jgi:putative peptidoglycan lipid II flippase
MSQEPVVEVTPARPSRGFVRHAGLISVITLLSRFLGLARESVAAHYFGAGAVWSAFQFAFSIPNLFRKLLGEGALATAFIPLYAATLRRDRHTGDEEARRFAAATINLLLIALVVITLLGEGLLALAGLVIRRPDHVLMLWLTAIMLPYVMLVCATAFLGAILQVHERFAAAAATSIVLNLCLIVGIVLGAMYLDLDSRDGQIDGVRWLAVSVLLAGVLQVLILLPSLRRVGFRLDLRAPLRTPMIARLIRLTIPVAIGAGVLQLGVLLDKGIATFLAAPDDTTTHFERFGVRLAYPMDEGAVVRLGNAQLMYQFPLGVFAIALATAIFPRLSHDAVDESRLSRGDDRAAASDSFRTVLRQGVEASLFIGLPASAGMILVSEPAIRACFESGKFSADDTLWTARSTAIYSAAIWAFSLQQIVGRAYYALHDTLTPLYWTAINLLINLVVELPLLWTPLRETALPVGTLASFAVQSLAMLWMLDRRAGGIGLRRSAKPVSKMLLATVVMSGACVGVMHLPNYPAGDGRLTAVLQVLVLMVVGGVVYLATVWLLGLRPKANLLPRFARRRSH